MAIYHVKNSTDKPIRVTINAGQTGQPIATSDVYPGRTERFERDTLNQGARYGLVATYPGWQANLSHTLTNADFDSMEVVGGPQGGYWVTY